MFFHQQAWDISEKKSAKESRHRCPSVLLAFIFTFLIFFTCHFPGKKRELLFAFDENQAILPQMNRHAWT
jgi:hypothetical protein